MVGTIGKICLIATRSKVDPPALPRFEHLCDFLVVDAVGKISVF